ncbi:DUF4062 domain-containing protein [Providencia alcalifaciens]|uniref:DUF4062 domain-containing protein n=1 Tax=Providencia alcalifaciens TaxID=126385 RepID=UPI0003E1DFB0|nr:DUF4062 domain-containing protein [Providencia alcalifaciens]ETS99728.1 PF13271 domain protein [Providencia alcalifaciens PAL-3]EUD00600.1 PF13271 domain protein [Providencia alcalifaciens PAL-1]
MSAKVRYQIFVSSTFLDLENARQEVTKHILNMNHIPAGMEMFSSNGYPQWDTIKKTIDSSDYYVLIVGERYGSICPDEGISYTEKEFNYAQSKGMPTLCFLSDASYTTTKDQRENDPEKQNKLEAFRSRITTSILCDMWSSEDALIGKISASLYKTFSENPGIGWIRGNTADPDNLTKIVKLMEENNRLKEKIKSFEEQYLQKVPQLSLSINNHRFEEGPLFISLPESDSDIAFIPQIHRKDIPTELTNYISTDEIDEYNNKLKTQEEIDSFHEKKSYYILAKQSKYELSILNSGTVKATDVVIKIFLPEGLVALSEEDIESLKEPTMYQPISLLVKAKRKATEQNQPFTISSPYPSAFINSQQNSLLRFNSLDDEAYIVDKNTIRISKASARQDTVQGIRSSIYIVPERKGTFIARVSIICDEYPEWKESEIEIVVE